MKEIKTDYMEDRRERRDLIIVCKMTQMERVDNVDVVLTREVETRD